jgi:hypothetical protein
MAGNQVRYGPNGTGNQGSGRSASMLTRTISRGRYSAIFRSTLYETRRKKQNMEELKIIQEAENKLENRMKLKSAKNIF